jgi:hypothetical protein
VNSSDFIFNSRDTRSLTLISNTIIYNISVREVILFCKIYRHRLLCELRIIIFSMYRTINFKIPGSKCSSNSSYEHTSFCFYFLKSLKCVIIAVNYYYYYLSYYNVTLKKIYNILNSK